MEDHVRLMLNEARSRIHDANILSGSANRDSDSDALLRILGFEILLKCALVVEGCRPERTHNYVKLWQALPEVVRASVLDSAAARMPGQADLSDIDGLLNRYQFVFERARYNYEMFEGYSDRERKELGELWVATGAVITEALVQYSPQELECLIHGLEQYIESAP